MDFSDSEQHHLRRTTSNSSVLLSPDENFEEFTLIWLDSDVHKTSDCMDTKFKLKQLINFVTTFDDLNQCLEYIRSIYMEKILFIISGKLGKVVLSDIHSLPQILLIYIFCENKVEHEQWSNSYRNKLQGVFVDKDDLLLKLNTDLKAISMNLMPLSVFDLATNESTIQDLNADKVTFLWFQLLIEVLLQIKHNNIHAKDEMIRECRLYYKNNAIEKNKIYEYNNTYTSDLAIKWYTRDSFVYRLINKALRTQNIDIIFKFRLFIKDLYNQLKNEHLLQFHNVKVPPFNVYRGQLMSLNELDKLKKNIGGYCSINTFLSTTTTCAVAADFAGGGGGRPTYESVVFEITVDGNRSDNDQNAKPFASIGRLSYMSDENEILFSIGTVFKIENVEQFDDMWHVMLTLSEQTDQNIQKLIDYYKGILHKNIEQVDLSYLAMLLVEMGDYDKAVRYYQILLDELSAYGEFSYANHQTELGCIHSAIGQVCHLKGDDDEAMKKYELALSMISSSDLSALSKIYNNMGVVYRRQGDSGTALEMYEKALELHTNLPDSIDLCVIYNNIGALYQTKEAYETALQHYYKVLAIKKQLLPPNHPNLTLTYNNIGSLHYAKGEYGMALQCFMDALNMQLPALPALHTDLSSSYNNIATVFDENRQYSEALVYYYKALEIYLANGISNHRDLSTVYTNIAINEKSSGNFSAAIVHYQLALEIELNYSTQNLIEISGIHQLIGKLYEQLSKPREAVTHYEKALAYRSHASSTNSDPEWFIHTYNIIGNSYKLQGEYTNALENYKKAKELMMKADALNNLDLASICVNIAHTSIEDDGNIENALTVYIDASAYLDHLEPLRTEHLPVAVTVYYNIAKLNFERNNTDVALMNFQKVLELKLSYMSENDSSLGTTYNNIAMCYTQKGDLSGALINFNHALKIHLSNDEKDQLNLALCYNNMAIAYTNHRQYVRAIRVLNYSIEIKRAAYSNNLVNDEDLALAYKHLAVVHERNKNYSQAYMNYMHALGQLQPSNNYCMLIEIYRSIGHINLKSKRYNEAVEYYEKVLDRSAALDNLTIALIHNEIGLAFYKMHDMQMALNKFYISLDIQLNKLPINDLSVAETYNLLGRAYSKMNEIIQAINCHEKAIKLILSTTNSDQSCDEELKTAYNSLACIYCQTRSYSDSLLYFGLAMEIQFKRGESTAYDGMNTEISATFTSIATIYCAQKSYNDALFYYEKALCYILIELFTYREKVCCLFGSISIILDNIALVWYRKNDRPRALSYLRAALTILDTSPFAEDQNFVTELNGKVQMINNQLILMEK